MHGYMAVVQTRFGPIFARGQKGLWQISYSLFGMGKLCWHTSIGLGIYGPGGLFIPHG